MNDKSAFHNFFSPEPKAITGTNVATGETVSYSSLREASLVGGLVRNKLLACCKTPGKTYRGYTWEFDNGSQPE